MLMGQCITGLGQTIPNVTYTANGGSGSVSSTYNFAGVSFGAADGGRYVIAPIFGLNTTAFRTINAITIGGVVPTLLYASDVLVVSSYHQTHWYSAYVPAGSTGDIDVTWSASQIRCFYAAHRAIGLNNPYATVDTDVNTAGATGATLSLDIQQNGYILGVAYGNVSPAMSWAAGWTEQFENNGIVATTTWGGALGTSASAATLSPTIAYGVTTTNRQVTGISLR